MIRIFCWEMTHSAEKKWQPTALYYFLIAHNLWRSVALFEHHVNFILNFIFLQKYLDKGYSRISVLGIKQSIFKRVMEWVYAGIFPDKDTDFKTIVDIYNASKQLGIHSLADVAKYYIQGKGTFDI